MHCLYINFPFKYDYVRKQCIYHWVYSFRQFKIKLDWKLLQRTLKNLFKELHFQRDPTATRNKPSLHNLAKHNTHYQWPQVQAAYSALKSPLESLLTKDQEITTRLVSQEELHHYIGYPPKSILIFQNKKLRNSQQKNSAITKPQHA